MQDSPDAKKPCKGILKTSSSFDKPSASYRKSAKFDELNVLQTFHPIDKDYGHMKIDEPKTPYNYKNPDQEAAVLDADLLVEKLRIAASTQSPIADDDFESDDDEPETEDEKSRRHEFELRRKAHYNEFEAVRLARKLIEEELGDDEEEDEDENLETEISNKDSDARQDAENNDKENASVSGQNSNTAASSSRSMEVDGCVRE